MRKFLRGIWFLLEVVIILYVLCVTSLILFRNEYGYTQFGDKTLITISKDNVGVIPDSKYGDLYVVNNNYGYKVGDKIYYYIVVNDSYMVRYGEVVKTRGTGSSTLYFVKYNDETNSVSSAKVIWDSVKIYNVYGKTISFLQGKIAFLFLVLLPIMIVFIYQVYELINIVKYEKVEDVVKKKDDNEDIEEL